MSVVRVPEAVSGRLRRWVRATPGGLMVLGIVTGAAAGAGAVVFRDLVVAFTRAFSGHSTYGLSGRVPNPDLPQLGVWFLVAAPVVGGLVYGPLIDRFAPEARGHGVPEVMLAVAQAGGRIRTRVALVKALASAICIGSGGSVGREGPIVQIGSAFGSAVGRAVRVPESRLRLLVACGAAAGISATFNAPIAGVFFALELILRDFEAESFGVVVLASVVADVIGRAAFGSAPFLALPGFQEHSLLAYPLCAGLGAAAGITAVAFVRVLYAMEDAGDHLWPGPASLRPAAGGAALGCLLLLVPQLYGVGYPVLEHAVDGRYAVLVVLGLLAGKMIATSLTLAVGGSGGVFAPSLFIGGMLGTAYGDLAARLFPHAAGAPGAYGLIGMGAVFAGAARAPVTALMIVFELTGDYRIILPMMVAVALASGVARLLSEESIYTLKLRRRGIDLDERSPALHEIAVREAMGAVPAPLAADDLLPTILHRLTADGVDALPVVADGVYLGVVTTLDAETAAADPSPTAADLAVDVERIGPEDELGSALAPLLRRDVEAVPVVSGGGVVVGWVTRRDVLRAYERSIARGDGGGNGVVKPSSGRANRGGAGRAAAARAGADAPA